MFSIQVGRHEMELGVWHHRVSDGHMSHGRSARKQRESEQVVKIGHRQSALGAFYFPMVGFIVLLYCALLHVVYQYEISPENVTRGLTYRTPDFARYSLAIFLVAVVAWCLPRECSRASDYMQWLPFIFAGAPSILLPQYMRALSEAEATYLALAVAGSLLLTRVLTFGGFDGHRIRPAPTTKIWTILVVLALAFYLYVAVVAGISFRWVSLGEEYEVRSSIRVRDWWNSHPPSTADIL